LKLRLSILLTVLSLVLPAYAGTCGNGYSWRRTVTIDHTKVPNTDQTDFPVLICFNSACTNSATAADLKTVANAGAVVGTNTNYIAATVPADVIFCDAISAGNALAFESSTYTASTGAWEVWVKIPSLSHTVDTVIYLFYGNASQTTTQDNCNTWSNNFFGVFHVPIPTTRVKDSSCSANHMTAQPSMNGTGQIDGGIDENTGGNGLNTPINVINQVLGNNPFTVSAWVNPSATGGVSGVTSLGVDSGGNTAIYLYIQSGKMIQEFASGTGKVTGSTTIGTSTWYYVASEYSTTTSKVFVNGAQDGSVAYSSANIGANSGSIGILQNAGCCRWVGQTDEHHWASGNRSTDWLTAEYNNQNDPSTFSSLGAAVNVGARRYRRISQVY
jgi:hypothetical protein